MLTTECYLDEIEKVHRLDHSRKGFCYHAVPLTDDRKIWRIAIVTMNFGGYYPLSEDFFMGTEKAMEDEAKRLNVERLDIYPHEAASIIAEAMVVSRRA